LPIHRKKRRIFFFFFFFYFFSFSSSSSRELAEEETFDRDRSSICARRTFCVRPFDIVDAVRIDRYAIKDRNILLLTCLDCKLRCVLVGCRNENIYPIEVKFRFRVRRSPGNPDRRRCQGWRRQMYPRDCLALKGIPHYRVRHKSGCTLKNGHNSLFRGCRLILILRLWYHIIGRLKCLSEH
jgi:hypothetical protein